MGSFGNILALDTAMSGCGVAVFSQGKSISRCERMSSGQAERLVPMMDDLMREAELRYSDLEVIVTTVGPGAFTGLRIGIAAAKALELSLDIPLYGITTLQALILKYASAAQTPGKEIAVIIETKRTDFYVQRFDAEARALEDPLCLLSESIAEKYADCVLIGDGVDRLRREVSDRGEKYVSGFDLPDMGFIAQYLASSGPVIPVFCNKISPVYLRDANVSQSKIPVRKITSK